MRVKMNKYLENIGITKDNYWVLEDHDGDPRYIEDEEGFVEAETWNLNSTLAMINYSYLCYFREHCLHAYPNGMTFEKWKEDIDKMIKAFELLLTEPETTNLYGEELKQYTKNRHKKIKFGLRLFAKYFYDLWW